MVTKRRSNIDDDDDGSPRNDDGYRPCVDCRSPTLLATLAQYGARCAPCYDAYCRSGPSGSGEQMRALTRDDKLAILQRLRQTTRMMASGNVADPKAWARRIVERHNEGEAVSHASLVMAREALGPIRAAPLNVDEGWE